MKHSLLKIAMVVAAVVTFSACTKKDTTPTTTPAPTPQYTASINTTPTTYTATATLGKRLVITAKSTNYTITIYDNLPVSVGNTGVTLSDSTAYSYATVLINGSGMYTTSYSATGTLYISSYNTTTNMVSGTFNFDANQGSFNMISVSDGSFSNIKF